jgi:uncharacterized membrane-anchored protein
MKTPVTLLLLFALVAVAQLSVPSYIIFQREHVLRDGHAYKFRTRPVDPYDAFRGRYVHLWLEAAEVSLPRNEKIESRRKVFATVAVGTNGFAYFTAVSQQRPANTADYVEAHSQWWSSDSKLNLELPFNAYFMDETLAPKAEEAYWENNRRGSNTNLPTYVTVRIKDGVAVTEELYIGGKPVREYLADQAKHNKRQ